MLLSGLDHMACYIILKPRLPQSSKAVNKNILESFNPGKNSDFGFAFIAEWLEKVQRWAS